MHNEGNLLTNLYFQAARSTVALSVWIYLRAFLLLFWQKAFDIYQNHVLVPSKEFFCVTQQSPRAETVQKKNVNATYITIPPIYYKPNPVKLTCFCEILSLIFRTSIFNIPGSALVSLALSLLCLSSRVSFTLDSSSVDWKHHNYTLNRHLSTKTLATYTYFTSWVLFLLSVPAFSTFLVFSTYSMVSCEWGLDAMIIAGESVIPTSMCGRPVSNDRMEASSSGTVEATNLSSLESLDSSVWCSNG